MITNYLENNHLILIGKVASEKKVSHEIYGERFYTFNLEVPRLSEISDLIPITISERLITSTNLEIGTKVIIEGQFRSYNGYENEKSKLILTVFAKDIKIAEELEEQEEELNSIKGAQANINFGSQIRSYVLHPYSMVKDHRTNVETSNVNKVLDGDIDMFIEANLKNK